jgi:hypothetical protein
LCREMPDCEASREAVLSIIEIRAITLKTQPTLKDAAYLRDTSFQNPAIATQPLDTRREEKWGASREREPQFPQASARNQTTRFRGGQPTPARGCPRFYVARIGLCLLPYLPATAFVGGGRNSTREREYRRCPLIGKGSPSVVEIRRHHSLTRWECDLQNNDVNGHVSPIAAVFQALELRCGSRFRGRRDDT